VRNSLGDAYYMDEAGILYMRQVQPPGGHTGTPNWKLPEWPNPPFTRAGLTIPTKSSAYVHIEIAADCVTSKNKHFCAGARVREYICVREGVRSAVPPQRPQQALLPRVRRTGPLPCFRLGMPPAVVPPRPRAR
jgi:hypothetical protein